MPNSTINLNLEDVRRYQFFLKLLVSMFQKKMKKKREIPIISLESSPSETDSGALNVSYYYVIS